MASLGDALSIIQQQQALEYQKEQDSMQIALRLLSMEAEKDAREDRQEHEKELTKISYEQEMTSNYPGLTFDETTGSPNFTGYDFTESTAFKVNKLSSTFESLRDRGLDTSGDAETMDRRLASHDKGRYVGSTMIRPSVDPDVAGVTGGDKSRFALTQQDIVDYEDWIHGSGGFDNPMVLESLVNVGIISTDILQLDTDTGLYRADDTTKELINNAMIGFKAGIISNESYMDSIKYDETLDAKRRRNLEYAGVLAESPGVTAASNVFNSTKASFGRILNAQYSEDGNYIMSWKGNMVEYTDIIKSIDRNKAIFKSPADRQNFKAFIKQLSMITPEGMGAENVLEQLNQMPVNKDGVPVAMAYLAQLDPGLAKSLNTLLSQYNTIQGVANISMRFIKEPKDINEVSDFKEFLDSTGLIYDMQEARQLSAAGKDSQALESEIDVTISQIISTLSGIDPNTGEDTGTANPALLRDFKNWLDLEHSLNDLRSISIEGRR